MREHASFASTLVTFDLFLHSQCQFPSLAFASDTYWESSHRVMSDHISEHAQEAFTTPTRTLVVKGGTHINRDPHCATRLRIKGLGSATPSVLGGNASTDLTVFLATVGGCLFWQHYVNDCSPSALLMSHSQKHKKETVRKPAGESNNLSSSSC